MTINAELEDFYQRHGFGDVPGERPRTVAVYTGCLLVPLPNIETRRKFLKYHDIHHLITGYSVGRIGEGEISAWELGTGSAYVSPILGIMNLIALSTGLILEPRRMWRAYERGCRSRNLYGAEARAEVDSGHWNEVAALRTDIVEVKAESPIALARGAAFSMYAILALFIHASLAIPAVITRFITDVTGSGSLVKALKPSSRTDLY